MKGIEYGIKVYNQDKEMDEIIPTRFTDRAIATDTAKRMKELGAVNVRLVSFKTREED